VTAKEAEKIMFPYPMWNVGLALVSVTWPLSWKRMKPKVLDTGQSIAELAVYFPA